MKKLSLVLLLSINYFDLKPSAAIVTNFGPMQISTDVDTPANRFLTIGSDGTNKDYAINMGTMTDFSGAINIGTVGAGGINIGTGTSTSAITIGNSNTTSITFGKAPSFGGFSANGEVNINTGASAGVTNIATGSTDATDDVAVNISNLSPSVTTGTLTKGLVSIGNISINTVTLTGDLSSTISGINIGTIDCDVVESGHTATNTVSAINIGTDISTNGTNSINVINIGEKNSTPSTSGINIGTGSSAYTINLGNNTSGGAISLNSKSSNISMTTTTGGDITATAAGNVSIKGSVTNAVNINVDTGAGTITYIGTGTTTGAINIGNATGGGNVGIISSGTNAVNINAGTGAATLTNIGTGSTTGKIVIGSTGQTTGGVDILAKMNDINLTTSSTGIGATGKIVLSTATAATTNTARAGNIELTAASNASATTASGCILLTTSGSGQADVGDIILTSAGYGIVKLAAGGTNGHIRVTATADIDLPGSGLSPISIDSTGNITTDVSSRVFKKDIENLNLSKEDFQKLRVVTYNMKDETKNKKGYKKLGLIAEELIGTKLECAIIFDKEGKPHSIDYQTIFVALLYRFLEAQKELDELKQSVLNIQEENNNIKANYENIEKEHEELKIIIKEIIMEIAKKNK
jgi:hypothetical protein